ncbi:MAG: hypothetical protein MR896_03340 [Clostridiales bacterium]|nr:hypothetical protein [Clostridiales bacterium]
MEKNIHDMIREFLKTANISNRKFAKFAGIPVSSFQTMLDRESELKASTYVKISSAMYIIMCQAPDVRTVVNNGIIIETPTKERERLFEIFDLITELSFDADANQNIKNSAINTTKTEESIYKNEPLENKTLLAFHSLNEEGQKAAVDQIELLTQIPKYQKQIKKIPPENGQDDN